MFKVNTTAIMKAALPTNMNTSIIPPLSPPLLLPPPPDEDEDDGDGGGLLLLGGGGGGAKCSYPLGIVILLFVSLPCFY